MTEKLESSALDLARGGAARVLGKFISSTSYHDLPEAEQIRTKGSVLDAVTCILAGFESPATELALNLARNIGAGGPSSFWLCNAKGSVENCAFVNSILIHGTKLDDGPSHTACVVVPVALAIAEAENRTGADVLAGIALGYEIQLRLDSEGLGHCVMERGFRHSSVNATFAATTTASYLLNLSAEETKNALAVTTALLNPGTLEPLGKGSERFVQLAGNAKNGVLSAMLARAGFNGSDTCMEGTAGLYFAYTGEARLPAGLLEKLGSQWHLSDMRIKPYPCSGAGTLPIYCTESLLEQNKFKYEDISGIELTTSPWGHLSGVNDPGPFVDVEQALVSVCFMVAATLVFGRYDLDAVLRGVGDDKVNLLAKRIKVVPSEAVGNSPATTRLAIILVDGQMLRASAANMPAAMTRQQDWENMVARFEKLASHVPKLLRNQIVEEIWSLDKRKNCKGLVNFLRSTVGDAAS